MDIQYIAAARCVYFFAGISQSKSDKKKNGCNSHCVMCVATERILMRMDNASMRPRQVTTPKFVIKRIKCVSVVQHRKLRVLRYIHLFLLHYCYHQLLLFVLFVYVSITLCLEQSAAFV